MLLNKKHKILYIANPKTATTAVQRWFMQEDDSFRKTSHVMNGQKIILKEHITALEAKKILGDHYFDQLKTLVFIRYPYDKIRSAYNFYRQKGKKKSLWNKNANTFKMRIYHFFQYSLAGILPFKLWALIYPFRDNFSYCMDENDQIIVTYIGRFEYLTKDLNSFLKELQLDLDISHLKMVNKSNKTSDLKISDTFAFLLKLRHPNLVKDLKFYDEISKRFSS